MFRLRLRLSNEGAARGKLRFKKADHMVEETFLGATVKRKLKNEHKHVERAQIDARNEEIQGREAMKSSEGVKAMEENRGVWKGRAEKYDLTVR